MVHPVIDATASIASIARIEIIHGIWHRRVTTSVSIVKAATCSRLNIAATTHSGHVVYNKIWVDPERNEKISENSHVHDLSNC